MSVRLSVRLSVRQVSYTLRVFISRSIQNGWAFKMVVVSTGCAIAVDHAFNITQIAGQLAGFLNDSAELAEKIYPAGMSIVYIHFESIHYIRIVSLNVAYFRLIFQPISAHHAPFTV